MIALVEGASRQKTPNEIALEHPPRRAHDHLPPRDRDAAAVRHLLERRAVRDRAHRAARLPDPDDDRRAALGDRHRRHGPARAAQRARDERPRRRGGRRLLDAPARQDRHDHARQPAGDRVHPARRASPRRSSPTRRSSRASPTRRPRVARSSCSPRSATASASARSHGAELVPFTAQTRMSGVDLDGRAASARARPTRSGAGSRSRAARIPAELGADRRRDRLVGRHAARRGRERPRPRRRPPQGRRQGGHQRALRRAAGDGDPHRDDHRRQPAHREGDRRRGRRRRLPRRGDARGQDGADQARAGGRRPRRDDRRRHERRPRARPGRRRRGDEHRHAGRQGGRATWSTSTRIRRS